MGNVHKVHLVSDSPQASLKLRQYVKAMNNIAMYKNVPKACSYIKYNHGAARRCYAEMKLNMQCLPTFHCVAMASWSKCLTGAACGVCVLECASVLTTIIHLSSLCLQQGILNMVGSTWYCMLCAVYLPKIMFKTL